MDRPDDRLYQTTIGIIRFDHDGILIIQKQINCSGRRIRIESVFCFGKLFDNLVRIEIYTCFAPCKRLYSSSGHDPDRMICPILRTECLVVAIFRHTETIMIGAVGINGEGRVDLSARESGRSREGRNRFRWGIDGRYCQRTSIHPVRFVFRHRSDIRDSAIYF